MGRHRSAWPARLALPVLLAVSAACGGSADPPPVPNESGTVAPTGAVITTSTEPTTSSPTTSSTTTEPEHFTEERLTMVDRQIEARGVRDQLVLDAMRAVPRHRFVPGEYVARSYADHPLPIGYGQTISQPYIVALMSEALEVEAGDRVLEIGTGSGYQAAVLAEMGVGVYTVEIIPELAEQAEVALREAGYPDVEVRAADGYYGWEEHAPFDGIIVTAAPDHIPQPLVAQLAPGARMVIPIGPVGAIQTLWVFTADADGELTAENLGSVSFVPFTRD
jgi:protein-L-isoaspartate(D-aspartate) O-methyltransferase